MTKPAPLTLLMLGATGTIGRAVAAELVARRHRVIAVTRGAASVPGTETRVAGYDSADAFARNAIADTRFDAVLSCMASRTGAPADAWATDHQAHVVALSAAQRAGIPQMVLLSAICVQKPTLAFQKAKLAFEAALIQSGLTYSIVRPTAFFKSLSGQIDRVRAGKPYLMFGDGTQTACKPISNRDLAAYMADCLEDPDRQNRILPIGGPGPAITPLDQGQELFRLTGQPPKYKRIPLGLVRAIVGTLRTLARVLPPLREKAAFAEIAQYYATQSMLVWDAGAQHYDAAATPEVGSDTLFDHYAQVIAANDTVDRGDHTLFK